MREKQLYSAEEMQQFGFELAEKLVGGDIVLLHGDLGAGKTTLTKGIAKYFGIDEVVSPTFTLMQVYQVSNKANEQVSNLVHIDTYRLEEEEQLVEIGIEDYLGEKNTVCIIEWPEKMERLLENKKMVNVWIKHSAQGRVVEIQD